MSGKRQNIRKRRMDDDSESDDDIPTNQVKSSSQETHSTNSLKSIKKENDTVVNGHHAINLTAINKLESKVTVDEGDYYVDSVPTLNSIPLNAKKGLNEKASGIEKSRLTFHEDLEDDENNQDDSNANILFRKSKISQKFKKMRQSPGALEVLLNQSEDEESKGEDTFASIYSAESLKALKEQQKYIAPKTSQSTEETIAQENIQIEASSTDSRVGMEFSGEAADLIEEELEVVSDGYITSTTVQTSDEQLIRDKKIASLLEKKKHRVVSITEGDDDDDGGEDFEEVNLYTSSFQNSAKKVESVAREVPNTARRDLNHNRKKVSFNPKPEVKTIPSIDKEAIQVGINRAKEFSALDDDSKEWEEEIIRRSKIHSVPAAMPSKSSSFTIAKDENEPFDPYNVLTIEEILQSVQNTHSQLNKSIDEIRTEHDKYVEEEARLQKQLKEFKEQLDQKVIEYNKVIDWNEFARECIEYLNSKESNVKEFVEANQRLCSDYFKAISHLRQEQIEDDLFDAIYDHISSSSSSRWNAFENIDDSFSPSRLLSNSILSLTGDSGLSDNTLLSIDAVRTRIANRAAYDQSDSCIQAAISKSSNTRSFLNLQTLISEHNDYAPSDTRFHSHASVEIILDKIRSIPAIADVIFDDVTRKDITSIDAILGVFNEFRNEMCDRYFRTFMTLSLPDVFDYLLQVSLAVIASSVVSKVDVKASGLSTWLWVSSIKEFSLNTPPQLISPTTNENDTDLTLLPRVMTRSVGPWLKAFIDSSYDPFSIHVSIFCSTMINDLAKHDVPSTTLAVMLESIARKFEDSLHTICFPITSTSSPRKSRFDQTYQTRNNDMTTCVVSEKYLKFILHRNMDVLVWIGNLSLFTVLLSPRAIKSLVWKSLLGKLFQPYRTFLTRPSNSSNDFSELSLDLQVDVSMALVLDSLFSLVSLSDLDSSDHNEMFRWNGLRGDVRDTCAAFTQYRVKNNDTAKIVETIQSRIIGIKNKIRAMSSKTSS